MSEITNMAEAEAALRRFYGKHATGPYTLDRMRALMTFLGNPQEKLRVIHVAGTSGKTSTAYFITSLLATAGKKVGLSVSPHVDHINERVQLNSEPMAEPDFCSELNEFLGFVERSGILPSYFEAMVAFAYWEFDRQQVDYAVMEVGLGGLLDGTNVVARRDKLCVITDIGLDHTELLGDTVEKIATQKAGIIQNGNDTFINLQPVPVMAVIDGTCKEQDSDLHVLETEDAPDGLPLFQRRNFALAREVADWITQCEGIPSLTQQQLVQASQVYIPARMELVKLGEKTLIIDGSHNAQKLQTLFTSIASRFPDAPIACLAGFVEGDSSRLHQALEVLTKHVEQLIVTSFYSEKDYPKHSVAPDQVLVQCHELGYDQVTAIESPAEAFTALLDRPEEVLLVTGSFYLLNHIRPLVGKHDD